MKKPFFASLLSKKSTSRNERNVRADRVRTRALQLENLESRELLSVAPGSVFQATDHANIFGFISGPFTVDEARSAYESSAATRADDAVVLPDFLFDGAEPQSVASVENDSTPNVSVDVQQFPDSEPSIPNDSAPAPVVGVSGPGEPLIYYDADKSAINTEDDNLCWAATASNMLWHTGWASVTTAQNEQEFFDAYFVNSWPDEGGNAETAISWFLNDESYYSGSTGAYASAGYYSQLMGQYGESASDYISVYSATESGALQSLSTSFANDDAVGLAIYVYSSQSGGHALTCWGYAVDPSYSSSDPRYYAGLYITDSDDEKSGKTDDNLNERKLVYVTLEWHDSLSRLSSNSGGYLLSYNGRSGDDRYYLSRIQTLKQRSEKYAVVGDMEQRSTVVTTSDDVYDVFDGKISLREAIGYAHPGDTITFADSLKGKTIKLNSEIGQLTVNKSLTIDASSLRSETSTAPQLTISGQNATRILRVDWGVKDVAINGIKFTNGKASDYGGGIYNYGGTLSLENCAICENAANSGGGAYSYCANTTFVNCLVANNTARYGGGVYSYSGSSYARKTTLVNCTVANNTANYEGGGILCNAYATTEAYNSIVCGNAVGNAVDDVYLKDSAAVVNAYNTLSSFSAWTNGANNLVYNPSKALFRNADSKNFALPGNSQAVNKGNDLYVATNVDLAGKNRISGANVDLGAYEYQYSSDLETLATPDAVACAPSYGSVKVSWKAVQGASGYRIAYRTFDGAYTTVDVESDKTRYTVSDLTQGETYYVKVAALGDGVTQRSSYYSPETSAKTLSVIVVTSAGDDTDANDGVVTLREALSLAKSGDKITFASSLKGKTISVNSQISVSKSVTIDASSLYTASTKTPGITLSGGNSTRMMYVNSGYTVVLKGLKFTDGRSSVCGGAIWNNGDLTVENCVFTNNNANNGSSFGGAIAVKSGAKITAKSSSFSGNVGAGVFSFQTSLSSTITDCEFANNDCDAFYIVSGEVSATNCDITDANGSGVYVGSSGKASLTGCNITRSGGAGVYVSGGEISLTNCVVNNNGGSGVSVSGGAVSLTSCSVTGNGSYGVYVSSSGVLVATNALIAGNTARYGAGVELYGTATLYNCTITGNAASYYGGGVEMNGSAVLNAYNTIIAGNTASSGADVYFYGSSSNAVANAYNTLSSYTSWTSGSNNLTYNASTALFTNATAGDYTLAGNSQAIDKGNNQHVATSLDLAGNSRVAGGTVDLGAYEYPKTGPLATPVNLRAIAKTETTITLAWDPVPNATGYRIAWRNKTETANEYVTLGASETSYKLADLANDATYYWKVQTLGGGVYTASPYSTAKTVTPRQKLGSPTVSVAAESSAITVSWTAVPNAVRYAVSYKLAGTTTWSNESDAGTNLSYTITGLASNTKYSVRVRAFGNNVDYSSSNYATRTITTPKPAPRPLDAPTNLQETAKTETTVTVSWNPVANATGYRIAWRNKADSVNTYVTIKDGSTTSYKLTKLSSDASYYWKIQALGDGDSRADSAYSAARTVAPRKKLDAPTLSASADASSITVSWDAVPGATKYYVSYKLASESTWSSNLNAKTNLSYTINGLASDAEYDVRVKAIGDNYDYSTSDYATTSAATSSEPIFVPQIISSSAQPTAITVSWTAAPNAVQYAVSYKLASSSTWSSEVNVGANLSHTITGLAPDTTYDVRVRAMGDGANDGDFGYDTATVATSQNVKPDTPANPRETAKTETTITVAWDAVPNATGYRIAWRNKVDSANSYITVDASTTSRKLTGLDNAASYYWKVQALGGDFTPARTVKPRQKLAAPTGTTAATATSATVSWNAVPHAVGYAVSYKLASESTWSEPVDVGTNRSYTITGLASNTAYHVRVKALGDEFDYRSSGFSSTLRVKTAETTITQLPAPNATVAAAPNSLTVSWDAVPNASRYSVSYKLASESTWTNKNAETNLSYTITGLESNTEYDVRVKAVGDDVNYKSAYSPIVRAQTTETTQLAAPVPSIEAKTATTITAAWSEVPNATGYRFIWKNQSDASFSSPILLDASTTSYQLTGLDNSATYVWKVLALGDGVSFLNSEYCETRRDKPQQTLAAPVLTVSVAPTSLTLDWTAVPNAERYSLSYKLASATTWTNVNAGTNCSYAIAELAQNARYDVRVKAVGDGVDYKSVYSAIVSAQTTSTSSALFDDAEDLFDEIAEDDYNLLAREVAGDGIRLMARDNA